jgi:hypothetical protein
LSDRIDEKQPLGRFQLFLQNNPIANLSSPQQFSFRRSWSSAAQRPLLAVPFIGRVVKTLPFRSKKSSGEKDSTR